MVGFDLAVRGVSRLACQRRPRVEENCREIGNIFRGSVQPLVWTPLGAEACVQSLTVDVVLESGFTRVRVSPGSVRAAVCLCPMTLTKWFYPTRLETRTKESSCYVSVRVANLYAE